MAPSLRPRAYNASICLHAGTTLSEIKHRRVQSKKKNIKHNFKIKILP